VREGVTGEKMLELDALLLSCCPLVVLGVAVPAGVPTEEPKELPDCFTSARCGGVNIVTTSATNSASHRPGRTARDAKGCRVLFARMVVVVCVFRKVLPLSRSRSVVTLSTRGCLVCNEVYGK